MKELSRGDRIRVKNNSPKLVGWEGHILLAFPNRYSIQFDKTPTITIMMTRETVEKIS